MTDTSLKRNFVSETEIEALKQKRQEEWEKVRKPDDPLEAPEEEYDPRSLYERLQEQKDKKELELEESRRLKNLIRGLDDDEVAFLELVDQTKIEMETKLWEEERKEIQEFRRAVTNITDEERETKLQHLRRALNIPKSGANKKSQHALLAGVLKRKASSSSNSPEKSEGKENESKRPHLQSHESPTKTVKSQKSNTISCLGVLPGLGVYSDSSDSDNSSDSEVDAKDLEYGLLGKRSIEVLQAAAAHAQDTQHR